MLWTTRSSCAPDSLADKKKLPMVTGTDKWQVDLNHETRGAVASGVSRDAWMWASLRKVIHKSEFVSRVDSLYKPLVVVAQCGLLKDFRTATFLAYIRAIWTIGFFEVNR
jgi:hypothetical protein